MRDLNMRFRLAVAAVVVWLVSDLGMALSAGFDLATTDTAGLYASEPLAAAARLLAIATGAFYTLAFIASIVFVAMWIHRANANAHALSHAMTMSPGWNVGFFFVPIASLFKPFQGLRETWQVSHAPDSPDAVPVPALMRWWWGLWIVTNMLGNASTRLSLNSDPVLAVRAAGWLAVAALLVDVPMTVLLIVFMHRLTAAQDRRMVAAPAH